MKHIHQFVLFGLLVGGLGLSCKTAPESPVIPPILVPITPPITDTSVPEVVSAKIVDDSGVIRIDQTTRLISTELSNKYAQKLVDISYSLTRNTYFSRRRSDILLQRLCSIGTATVEVKTRSVKKTTSYSVVVKSARKPAILASPVPLEFTIGIDYPNLILPVQDIVPAAEPVPLRFRNLNTSEVYTSLATKCC